MAGHLPSLDAPTLARLRELVAAFQRENARTIPMESLVALAGIETAHAITLDLDAQAALGCPVVILRPDGAGSDVLGSLSRREREVAELLTQGLSNKEIAARLFISVATTKDHVHSILRKTGCASRAELIASVGGTRSGGGG